MYIWNIPTTNVKFIIYECSDFGFDTLQCCNHKTLVFPPAKDGDRLKEDYASRVRAKVCCTHIHELLDKPRSFWERIGDLNRVIEMENLAKIGIHVDLIGIKNG